MDYQVAFYQDSWQVNGKKNTADIIEQVINTRDAAISQLRLPPGQEGKFDVVSCGIWIKVRTDRPHQEGKAATTLLPDADRWAHRPSQFSNVRDQLGVNQIRLLEILPGVHDDMLRANLVTFDIANTPPYVALSYIWGDTSDPQTIALGADVSLPPESAIGTLLGGNTAGQERITRSLHGALSFIRDPKHSRYVWADAVCINQGDVHERSQQVAMMGNIFSGATQVIVWLGQATEHSAYGMQMLQRVVEGRAFDRDSLWGRHPPELVQKGLIDVLNRSWFKRIWTVQEAALSSKTTKMVCSDGSYVEWSASPVSVYLFIRGLKYAAVSMDWNENGLAGSAGIGLPRVDLTDFINLLGQQLHQVMRTEGFKRPPPNPDLLDIAYEVKDRECTDPRDRLYGVIGLALIRGSDAGNQLRPDYSKTMQQVHDDFRKLLLEAAQKEPAIWKSAERI